MKRQRKSQPPSPPPESHGDWLSLLPPKRGEMVLVWLEKNGHPLNSRCGGRGLCRGCQIEARTSSGVETIRSCQVSCSDLRRDFEALRIPRTSRRDSALHGVSVFELADFPMPPRRPGIGLALDIGTTTVAATLWDFSTGICLADGSTSNAQRQFGDNVLSRITYASEKPSGRADLQRALLNRSVLPLLRSICDRAGIKRSEITQANAAGNPIMLHTLAGESLEGFERFPFRPRFLGKKILRPGEWLAGMRCDLELLPALGPFVGSDIAAGALAAGLLSNGNRPALLIDFGTNGEILLKTRDGFLATATAAGPAFEGGRLSCGAPAAPGIISALDLEGEQWIWQTQGNETARPHGISGAAYVDFIALGAKEGWISPTGRLDRTHPAVSLEERDDPRSLARVHLSPELFVSEADIAEILQAKAAIAGGVATLLEVAGLDVSDLETLFVAGGFGYHLRPSHAQILGLLPRIPRERISLIGNSSLGGASLLLHPAHQRTLDELPSKTRIIELNKEENFQDHFTDALMLPERE